MRARARRRSLASKRALQPGRAETMGLQVAGRTGGAGPELHDVEATNEVSDIDEWFAEQRTGELLVGPHPFRHDADPDADFLAAWNAGADGEIRPGAY